MAKSSKKRRAKRPPVPRTHSGFTYMLTRPLPNAAPGESRGIIEDIIDIVSGRWTQYYELVGTVHPVRIFLENQLTNNSNSTAAASLSAIRAAYGTLLESFNKAYDPNDLYPHRSIHFWTHDPYGSINFVELNEDHNKILNAMMLSLDGSTKLVTLDTFVIVGKEVAAIGKHGFMYTDGRPVPVSTITIETTAVNKNSLAASLIFRLAAMIHELDAYLKDPYQGEFHFTTAETELISAIARTADEYGPLITSVPIVRNTMTDLFFERHIGVETNVLDAVKIQDLLDAKKIPILHLSNKEWMALDEMMEDNGYLHNDGLVGYNMIPVATNPRYGPMMIYPVDDINGEKRELIIRLAMIGDDKNKAMYITAFEKTEHIKKCNLVYTMIFDHPESVYNMSSMSSAYISYYQDVLAMDTDLTKEPLKILRTDTRDPLFNDDRMREIIRTFLAVYIMMDKRPTIFATNEPRDTRNYSPSNGPTDHVTIRLMYHKSIKREPQYHRQNVEYVMESWHRSGYWRRCKHGGKCWVPPTTCYRHNKLVEKEIRVKL